MNDKIKSLKELGLDVPFQRVRRITGYLAYAASFNNGKRAELFDRIKHSADVVGISASSTADHNTPRPSNP